MPIQKRPIMAAYCSIWPNSKRYWPAVRWRVSFRGASSASNAMPRANPERHFGPMEHRGGRGQPEGRRGTGKQRDCHPITPAVPLEDIDAQLSSELYPVFWRECHFGIEARFKQRDSNGAMRCFRQSVRLHGGEPGADSDLAIGCI